MTGKYGSLNVLNIRDKASDFMSDDVVRDVANMVNSKGQNRAQRRRLEKSLKRVETIRAYAQYHLDESMLKEYQKNLDKDTIHFCAILAMVCYEDYRWKEDDNHDQISSMIERVVRKINKYINMEYKTEDILELVYENTGIVLVPDDRH